MTPSRSARASFCSDLVAALVGAVLLVAAAPAARAAAEPSPLATLRAIEFETALAREPRVYLVLAAKERRLDIKSRGMVLERVPVAQLSVLHFVPLFGSSSAPELVTPALWRVRQGPGDTDRETIAPTTLRPYSEEEEQEEPAAGTPPAKPAGEAEKPATYRVAIDNGWQLLITDQAPQLGFLRRFAAAVRDGWLRFKGEEPAHPPLVTLVVERAAAQRLHHLFRSGTEILLLP